MNNDLKSSIYMVVAMPKQFLWAPFEIAIVNMILAIAFMLLCIAVLGITPFVSLIPLVFGHAALIGIGTRNPHLTTTLRAIGKYPQRRKNLTRLSRGVKYVP
jgi:hypothetical protein